MNERLPSSSSITVVGSNQEASAATKGKVLPWRTLLPPILQSFAFQFISGVNDGNLGIMLPSIKAHYDLSQPVVSVIFLCNATGYILAALLNGVLVDRFSQAKTALFGCCLMVFSYSVILFGFPFPVLTLCMVLLGFGVALTQSCSNVVCGEMPHNTLVLNVLHAFFGAGGLVGPLMASTILSAHWPWTASYMVLCGLSVVSATSTAICFRNFRTHSEQQSAIDHQDDEKAYHPAVADPAPSIEDADHVTIYSLASPSSSPEYHAVPPSTASTLCDPACPEKTKKPHDSSLLSQIVRYRIIYVGALFLLFYVGTEVTVGNWGYTFLISVRSMDTIGMAHIMSGYWAGLCMGRLLLGFLTLKWGEKRMVLLFLSVIVGMLFVVYFVPLVTANATALVLIGFLLGPIFPTTVAVAQKVMPAHLYATSVGFLSAFGSGGSALFPYLIGVLIAERGVEAMLPFCIAMASAMWVAWLFIPNPSSSTEQSKAAIKA